jgi:hypothetical protein
MLKMFELRDAKGHFLATYRAKNAAAAIERLKQDDRNTASTFRKSQPASKFEGVTAKEIEPHHD